MSHHSLAEMIGPGTRLTTQRQLIWNVLHRSGGHLSAEQIRGHLAARLPGVNLPTVYRNLQFLRGAGLVQELHLGEGPVRFEAVSPAERHPHLVCRGCGTIEHPEAEPLAIAAREAAAERHFGAEEVDVVLYGTCAACARQARIAAGGPA